MADGLALAELVEVRLEGGGGDGEVLVQEAEKVGGIAGAGVSMESCAGLETNRCGWKGFVRASRTPGCWASARVASARRPEGMARRSRTSTGAVVWLMPTRTSETSLSRTGGAHGGSGGGFGFGGRGDDR